MTQYSSLYIICRTRCRISRENTKVVIHDQLMDIASTADALVSWTLVQYTGSCVLLRVASKFLQGLNKTPSEIMSTTVRERDHSIG